MSFQRLLINTGSSFPGLSQQTAGTSGCGAVLGFEGKLGKGRDSIPDRGGTRGEATQGVVVARKVWPGLVQSDKFKIIGFLGLKNPSKYSWGSLFVLFGSSVPMEEFCCEPRG